MNDLLASLRFVAVVDWLELDVRTRNAHPAWRVREASKGAFSYVTGLDAETGKEIATVGHQGKNTPTKRFLVRIQAPERFASVAAALSTIKDCESTPAITVRSIEVAFDAYRKDGTTDEQLAEMTAIMLHQINRPIGTNEAPRLYSGPRTAECRYGKQSLKAALLSGKTGMYGNACDDFIVRGYLKNYDTITKGNDGPECMALDNHLDHRARIEIRLQNKACPIRTIDDLRSFRFETLASFFKFHEQADDASALASMIANRCGSLGSVIEATGQTTEAHAKEGRPRKTRPNSKASPLNEIARDQLRKLSRRWSCATGRNRRQLYENSGAKAVGERSTNSPPERGSQQPENPRK